MTIRDILNRKKRNAALLYFSAFTFLIISLLISSSYKPIIFFAVLAALACIISLLYLLFGIRCPKCNNYLGIIISYFGGPFAISKKFNYCPFRGIKMDDRI